MLFDHISSAAIYYSLGEEFTIGLRYLQTFKANTPDGKVELDGQRVYASVEFYTTTPAVNRDYEAHRNHADIQYIVSGEELIYHAPLSRLLETTQYNIQKDVTMYAGDDIQPIYLSPGDFTILWPQDAHKPNCSWHGSTANRKIVIKVRLG